ncbi:PIN domain-containing protein [Testudinibacter sp. P27/CKL/0425]
MKFLLDTNAVIAGKIRADLEKSGTPIDAYDILIAAQAVNHNLMLITHNTKEFQRINMPAYEDWL